jgi:hypothetical protein
MEFEDILCAWGIGIICGLFIAAAIGCWYERRKKPPRFYVVPLNDALWQKDDFGHLERVLYAEHQARKERIQ